MLLGEIISSFTMQGLIHSNELFFLVKPETNSLVNNNTDDESDNPRQKNGDPQPTTDTMNTKTVKGIVRLQAS